MDYLVSISLMIKSAPSNNRASRNIFASKPFFTKSYRDHFFGSFLYMRRPDPYAKTLPYAARAAHTKINPSPFSLVSSQYNSLSK